MALTKETITRLASLVGISASDLTEKITSEDTVALDVPKLYSEEEKDTFGRNRFGEGKTAMREILVKDLREKYPDVKYTGKDVDKFMDAYKSAVLEDAEADPDSKVKELEETVATLQQKYENDITEREQKIKDLHNNNYRLSTTQQLVNMIDNDTVIPKGDIVTLFLSKHELEQSDDGTLVKKDGKVLKDELQSPIKLNDYFKSWVDDNKYIGQTGMGGNDDKGKPGDVKEFTKMSEAMDYFEEKGIDPMSEDAQKFLSEKKAETFDYNG